MIRAGLVSDTILSEISEDYESRRTPQAYYTDKILSEKKIEHCVITIPLYTESKPTKLKKEEIIENELTKKYMKKKLKIKNRKNNSFGTLVASVIDVQNQGKDSLPFFHKEIFWLAAHLPLSTAEEDLEAIIGHIKENLIESWIKKQRYKINIYKKVNIKNKRGRSNSYGELDSSFNKEKVVENNDEVSRSLNSRESENMNRIDEGDKRKIVGDIGKMGYEKETSAPFILNSSWRKKTQFVVSLYINMPKDPTSYLYTQVLRAIGLFQKNKKTRSYKSRILMPQEALTMYVHLIHCPDDLGNIALVRRNLIIISGDPDSYGAAGSGISLMRAVPRPSLEVRRMYSLSSLTSDDMQMDCGNKIFNILFKVTLKRLQKLIEKERERRKKEIISPNDDKKPENTFNETNNVLQSICVFLCYISLGPDKIVSLEGHTGVDGYMHLLIRRISVMYESSSDPIYKEFPLEVLLAGLWRCGSSHYVDGYIRKMELLINMMEIAIGPGQSAVLRRLREVFRVGASNPPAEYRREEMSVRVAQSEKGQLLEEADTTEGAEAVGIGRM